MIWGFGFAAQKSAAAIPAFSVGALRTLFASVFLFLLILIFDSFKKRAKNYEKRKSFFTKTEIIGGIMCGFVLALASAFQQFGISDGTDAGKAAFITALYVVLVPVISRIFGKKTALTVWISVIIAALGFYLLCIKNGLTIEPSDTLVLVCAFIFATHIIVIDRFSPSCDGIRMSFIQFVTAFVLYLILTLIFELPMNTQNVLSALPSLLYLGVGSSGIAFTLQIIAQKDADPTVASIVMSLESVFGVVGGVIFFNESMSIKEYIGCAIVFLAVILSQLDADSIKKLISKGKSHE